MKWIMTLYLFQLFFYVHAQKKTEHFNFSTIQMEYETKDGKLSGQYVSKYRNGTKRAEGNFTDNVRTGVWTVYDSLGRKIHQREYLQHLSYKKLFPEKETNGAASLFDTSIYTPSKNKNGYIDYFSIAERMVVFSTRVWRELSPALNKVIFEKDILYKTVFGFITDSTQTSYCSKTDSFKEKMTLKELREYSLKNYKIIAWKLKEDFIYDIERNVSETRIIGICPVGVNLKSKDTSDLYWVYFPMMRLPLSAVTIKNKTVSSIPISLDDIFFQRKFSGEIYKQWNRDDLLISEYCSTPEKVKFEQQRIEIEMIETEHEIWLGNLPD